MGHDQLVRHRHADRTTIIPKPIWLVASLGVLVIAAACASEADGHRTAPDDRATEQASVADAARGGSADDDRGTHDDGGPDHDDNHQPSHRGDTAQPDSPPWSQPLLASVQLCMTDSVIDTSTPEALMRTFTDRVHARDLDGLVALYETAAVFEPRPGVVVEGRDAIRQVLAELLALGPIMAAVTVEVLQADNVALVINEWTMTGTASDGNEVRQGGRSADVVRRQPGGGWCVLVDKP